MTPAKIPRCILKYITRVLQLVHAPNEHKEEKHQHKNSKMNPVLSTQWQKSSGQEERDENPAIDASCPPT